VRGECLPRQSSAGVARCTPRVEMTPCVWRGSVCQGVTLWTWCRRLSAGARIKGQGGKVSRNISASFTGLNKYISQLIYLADIKNIG
jgi:hypothetical protein